MKKNTLLITNIVIGFNILLSACSPNISGLQEGRDNCLSYGYKSGSENYAKCILFEDERRAEKKIKEQMHKKKSIKLN
ncbi:MAG: hypothetical protein Q8L85_02080 [Alphaproteobacteria bacterium]|nr:hypothetical protein [Alphaproteobacteria bacterium]